MNEQDKPTNDGKLEPYFESYSHWSIHEEMIKDTTRTGTYQNSIEQNPHLFKDKIVLDIGCGTGILSLFCARAGAKHVYAVDASNIISKAKEIVELNGYSNKVTCLQGKMEEINLPVDKVDIIISEWMGYFLLYESMLDTVLFARDKYLAPNGLIFPDKLSMKIAGIEDGEYKHEKIGFWENVYGFNFSPFMKDVIKEPLVDFVGGPAVATNESTLLEIDLYTVNPPDLFKPMPFKLIGKRADYIHALVAWFDVNFSHCAKPVQFSTGPFARNTHWKQTVFYLHDVISIEQNELISGKLTCQPNEHNHRHLDIQIDIDFTPSESSREFHESNDYYIFEIC